MRKGLNPAKQSGSLAYKPERLGILATVYIPDLAGYFQDVLTILKIHVASIHQYTSEPFNYVVIDNNSCSEVRQNLLQMQEAGLIDWLILSNHNLGKTGALNMAVPAMPNEWICYCDYDMLFRPGWLEATRKIHANFPECGMTGAQVVYPDKEIDKGNTLFRSQRTYQFSTFRPESWILEEYCRGRGIQPEKAAEFQSMELDLVTNPQSGVAAVVGGNSHQQWLARKDVVMKVFPLPAEFQMARPESTTLDVRMDELGYAHLTTLEPYLYHLGNSLDDQILPEIARLKDFSGEIYPVNQNKVNKGQLLPWLARNPALRRFMIRLYDRLYRVLYG